MLNDCDCVCQVIGLPGVVNYIHSDGDPDIRFITNQIYRFNADVVSKVGFAQAISAICIIPNRYGML